MVIPSLFCQYPFLTFSTLSYAAYLSLHSQLPCSVHSASTLVSAQALACPFSQHFIATFSTTFSTPIIPHPLFLFFEWHGNNHYFTFVLYFYRFWDGRQLGQMDFGKQGQTDRTDSWFLEMGMGGWWAVSVHFWLVPNKKHFGTGWTGTFIPRCPSPFERYYCLACAV